MKLPIESGIVVLWLLLLQNNYHEVQGIFFTTIGLTGATTSTAVITQSAALLPVLGLLALAAKVTKLKLSQNQNTGYGGGGGGGYGYGHGGGQGGFGHGGGQGGYGGGGGGGGFGGGHGHYSSFHHKRIGRRDVLDYKEARTLERPRRVTPLLPQPRSTGPYILSSKVNPGSNSPTPQVVPKETIDQGKKMKELNALEEIFKTINLLDYNFDCVKLHLCAIGKDSSNQVKSGAMTSIDEGIEALLSKMCPAIPKNSSLEPSCKAFLIGKSAKINDECYTHFNKCSLDSSILGQTGENTPALV